MQVTVYSAEPDDLFSPPNTTPQDPKTRLHPYKVANHTTSDKGRMAFGFARPKYRRNHECSLLVSVCPGGYCGDGEEQQQRPD
jgi:hypothetical protein